MMQTTDEKKTTRRVCADIEELQRKPIWSVDEVVLFLNLPSSNWIYQRVHSRSLPFRHFKCGAYLRFRQADVRKWIEQQTSKSA